MCLSSLQPLLPLMLWPAPHLCVLLPWLCIHYFSLPKPNYIRSHQGLCLAARTYPLFQPTTPPPSTNLGLPEMESAILGAEWLLGKVLNLLADDLVADYVASRDLGLNLDEIKRELNYTHGLLHEAREMGMSNNRGLQELLQQLRRKGDDAEDVLDELHYFRIRDKLDGTNKFDPGLPDDLFGQVVHGGHAMHHSVGNRFHSIGNYFWRFFSSSKRDHADVVDHVINNPKRAKYDDGHDIDHLGRVAMSNNIKSVIEGIQSLCQPIIELLKIKAARNPVGSMGVTVGKQRDTGSIPQTTKLYGREVILNQTISDMTSGNIHHETLSVLPIFGMGGVGKTTLAQHLYNHEKIEQHFTVRAWVCVSTNFDVLKLTKGILECIPAEKSEDCNRARESNNLDQLQQSIVKRLKSKRFLIVLDDIWECSLQKWENLLAPLKNSESERGSMVLVTTRFLGIAQEVKTNNSVHLEGLEPGDMMKWFQEYIFDQVIAGSYDHECMVEIAKQIAAKLKGSPLAATTVGRILKKNFSQEHWKGILERQEWLDKNNSDGIMPALKISYNYLPFHLKKCFLYFGLFPEDYRFHNLNITQFWDAIGIISSNDKPEVTGLKYLEEFVNHGFLSKEADESNPSYVMHDLLHELSQCVSSHECANISSTSLRADYNPRSIQHLSITIGKSDGNFEEEMDQLRRRVDVGRLRSLMIFGNTSASVDTILGNALGKIKRLRVLSIILKSDESWPQNFSELIHLRYLRISYPNQDPFSIWHPTPVSLPTTISTLYHLKFFEISSQNFFPCNLPRNFNRLVSLRHFVTDRYTHSNVPEVGEIKYLQELKMFIVKKESAGFELDQLGKLKELGGELCICGIEKVETMKEASKADLSQKRNLRELTLKWEPEDNVIDGFEPEDNVIDGFEPHPNLIKLHIYHHPGAVGPRWLCRDIFTTWLESLHLCGISWNVLPPFGLLPRLKILELSQVSRMSQFGPDFGVVTENSFASLKRIAFHDMPDLVGWVGGAVNHHFFSRLEGIQCSNCPKLSVLPFSECTNPCMQETNTVWFPNLCHLFIDGCPELSLPPLPHTSTLTYISVEKRGQDPIELKYQNGSLDITKFSCALAFYNLDKVEKIRIEDAPQISLTDLRKLDSLRDLSIKESEIDFLFSGDPNDNLVLPSVQKLRVKTFHPIRKLLSRVLKCFPDLIELDMTLFGEEAEHEEQVLPAFPSYCWLRKVTIGNCRNLVLPLEDGGGFRGLASLESLSLKRCGKIFSRWSTGAGSDRGINPFPASLGELKILEEPSMRSMDLIRNLTSLTRLDIICCDNLTVDGFNPHITLNLKRLSVYNVYQENRSIAADLFTEVARRNPLAMGFFHQLECLRVDSIAAVLVDPICRLLSAKLVKLEFYYCDDGMESFIEEQDKALQQLGSLEVLEFWHCSSLQCLPEGLHGLRCLKRIVVFDCEQLRSLPQNGLPTSLEELIIFEYNSMELQEEAQKLDRGRYPNLIVSMF